MEKVTSMVEVIIEGISISENFKIDKVVHRKYIRNIECIRYDNEKIKVTAEIESNNKNKNYLIYLDLKEYLLRIFVLFGVNVRIDESKTTISTDNDYIKTEHVICPPIISVDSNEILSYSGSIKDTLHSRERNGEFYNLIESNQNVGMVHRFRSLFATFDNIAPKNGNSINYHDIKQRYIDIINLYYKISPARYYSIILELIRLGLTDINTNKNYSNELDQSLKKLQSGTIINKDVAFNILKCIQIVRNKINHGDFEELTPKAVSGSYELLLPLTQDLMKEILL